MIAHAGFAGIDLPGRIFLALSVYHRHSGSDDGRPDALSNRLRLVVSKRTQKRAKLIGAAIRTAHMLSIGMAGIIDETRLIYEGSKLVMILPKAHAGLNGERLRRRLQILAELLLREGEIRVAE